MCVPLHAWVGAFSEQASLRNRVLVSFDWFKTFLFGRDIAKQEDA